jgi:hypothetical protein
MPTPTMLWGSLSLRNGASSGCGWRRRPPNMEVSCECIEYAVTVSRQGEDLHFGLGEGLTNLHHLVTKC